MVLDILASVWTYWRVSGHTGKLSVDMFGRKKWQEGAPWLDAATVSQFRTY
jgi:hypothetical protein